MPVAAVAAVASISASAISTGMAISQAKKAKKQEEEARKAMENYNRQELENPYERLSVSTAGADLQREDIARSLATYSNAASQGGSRAIVGLLPNILSQQNEQERKIAAELDNQYIQNDNTKAQGDAMVQSMTEQREKDDLLGIGNQMYVAQANKQNATNNAIQSGIGLVSAIGNAYSTNAFKSGTSQQATPTTPLQPVNTQMQGVITKQPNITAPVIQTNAFDNQYQNNIFSQQNPFGRNTSNPFAFYYPTVPNFR